MPDGKPKGWDCIDASEADIHRLIEGAGDFVDSLRERRDDEIFVPTMGEFLDMDLTPPEFLVRDPAHGGGAERGRGQARCREDDV